MLEKSLSNLHILIAIQQAIFMVVSSHGCLVKTVINSLKQMVEYQEGGYLQRKTAEAVCSVSNALLKQDLTRARVVYWLWANCYFSNQPNDRVPIRVKQKAVWIAQSPLDVIWKNCIINKSSVRAGLHVNMNYLITVLFTNKYLQ